MRILPTVLTEDPADLKKKLQQAASFTDWVQVDIMDGQFVPSRSIMATDLVAVPPGLLLEVHLMVLEPEAQMQAFHQAGARKIIFHYEATSAPEEAIRRARALGLEVGLALNPETPLWSTRGLWDKIDSILLLSVNPGFYGKEFLPDVLDKARELRLLAPGLQIGMDGGIKANNLLVVKAAGVDYACVGSAIFHQPDPRQSFLTLKAAVERG